MNKKKWALARLDSMSRIHVFAVLLTMLAAAPAAQAQYASADINSGAESPPYGGTYLTSKITLDADKTMVNTPGYRVERFDNAQGKFVDHGDTGNVVSAGQNQWRLTIHAMANPGTYRVVWTYDVKLPNQMVQKNCTVNSPSVTI